MSRWLSLSAVILVASWAASAYLAAHRAEYFPEQVPVHWNAQMEPDRWASRDSQWEVFYLFPLINTGVYAMLLALPWLSPRKFKIDDFRPVYDYIAFLMVVLFAALQGIILYGQSQGELPGRLFLGVFFAFFGLLGNVLGKVRKNFYVGIRTPWTLASETVWEKTHRLGAWLFVATGVGGFVAVMLGAPFWWCFPAILVAAFVPVIYSLIIYKQLERAGKLDVPTDGAGTTTV